VAKALLLKTMRKSVPVYGFSEPFVRAGALFGLAIDLDFQGRRAAALALRVYKDQLDKGDLYIEPEEGKLVVNISMARQLNILLTQHILRMSGSIYGK